MLYKLSNMIILFLLGTHEEFLQTIIKFEKLILLKGRRENGHFCALSLSLLFQFLSFGLLLVGRN